MKHEEFFIEYKKYKLYGQSWEPEEYSAIVLLVHGMGEHSDRYKKYVIPELLEKKFLVLAYDNFGHGKSSGKRGDCPGYESLLEVLGMVFSKAQELAKKRPIFIYGHSMGGNLVLNYVLRNNPNIAGAVVSSPFLRLAFEPPAWKISLGKALQKMLPGLTLSSGLAADKLSRNTNVVKEYHRDPKVHDRISPNFSFPVMEAGVWAIDNASILKKPVLLIHGTADEITDHHASEVFALGSPNTKLVLFDEGYHELHHDLEQQKVMDTITSWINEQKKL